MLQTAVSGLEAPNVGLVQPNVVTITRSEHDKLVRNGRKARSDFKGHNSQIEELQVSHCSSSEQPGASGTRISPKQWPSSLSSGAYPASKDLIPDTEVFQPGGVWNSRRDSVISDLDSFNALSTKDGHNLFDNNGFAHQTPQYHHETRNHDGRGVFIKGLSEQTTLKDIAKAIRGGAVLNMYLRSRDRSAHVVFVEPHAADAFYTYSRRNDIYILGKRDQKAPRHMVSHPKKNISMANRFELLGLGGSESSDNESQSRSESFATTKHDIPYPGNPLIV
ncbi:MAG: hypothetical protein Q9227_008755 [Pyrenula ochraceoflavens]